MRLPYRVESLGGNLVKSSEHNILLAHTVRLNYDNKPAVRIGVQLNHIVMVSMSRPTTTLNTLSSNNTTVNNFKSELILSNETARVNTSNKIKKINILLSNIAKIYMLNKSTIMNTRCKA